MDSRIQLLLWVTLSIVIGLGACVAYRARGERYWHEDATGTLVGEVALFVYHVGLPFVALIAGSISLDLLGLGTGWSRTDHLVGFTLTEWLTGIATAVGAVMLVIVVLALNRRAMDAPPNRESTFVLVRNAVYDEVHWALYRAPFILIFADAFFGAIVGIAVMLGEWMLRRSITRGPLERNHLLVLILCAVVSAFLFVTTRNLWVMIAADLAVRLIANTISTTAPQPRASS